MKKHIAVIIFLLIGGAGYTQDLIMKIDGSVIESKITEIYEDEIHYKRYINPDGPTYIVPIEKIQQVQYENGDIETFALPDNQETKTYSVPKQGASDQIIVRSGLYYYKGQQISIKRVKQLFAEHNSEEAITMWQRSNMNQGLSIAANIISYPVVILSYLNPLAFVLNPVTVGIIQVGGYVVSAGLQVAHYGLRSLYRDQRLEAVELYNDDIKQEIKHDDEDYY